MPSFEVKLILWVTLVAIGGKEDASKSKGSSSNPDPESIWAPRLDGFYKLLLVGETVHRYV